MPIIYESYAETRDISVPLIQVAEQYERTHFVAHAIYAPGVTRDSLMAHATQIENDIENKVGYKAPVHDIQIKHFPPFMTDVDFIIDVPVVPTMGYRRGKFSPIAPLVLVAILAVLAVIALGLIILFWTVASETILGKVWPYYCDQESPPSQYQGFEQYLAHLAEKHPTKYKAIQDAESNNWWQQLSKTVQWVIGGGIAIALIGLIAAATRRTK